MSTTLKSIVFTDIYLGVETALLSGVPGTLDPTPVPAQFTDEITTLRELCEKTLFRHGRDDFSLRHTEISYRVSVLRSISEIVFVLRRFPDEVPKISSLGIHSSIIERVVKPGLVGLIVVSGAFGQGKTTTASAIVSERLSRLGGVGVTVEEPPEMPLQGRHGDGVCYQTWVKQGEFAESCRKATRWAPTMILLGEVRDSETAIEALRAAVNGRLVVCTAHADSAIMAIERIFALANGAGSAGSPEDISGLLASGLAGVLHQKLVRSTTEGGSKRLQVETLWLDAEDAPSIRATISSRRFNQLVSVVQMQKNRLLMAGHANQKAS